MTNSNVTPPPAATELSDFTAIIVAVATGFGAYRLFEPKLDKARAVRNEVQNVEPAFRVHYVWPQYVMIAVSTLAAVFLIISFVNNLRPDLIPAFVPLETLSTALAIQNIIWVVFSLGVFAAAIYWNILSKLLLLTSRAISALPLPGLQNRFGPSGDSIGWHQAASLVEGPDKGQPLLVDREALERLAAELLVRLSKRQGSVDFAAEPVDLSASERANMALFGCVMESNHYVHRWASPSWSEFYASLADVQRQNQVFSPHQMRTLPNGRAFFEAFRTALDAALVARGQPSPPDQAMAAASDIVDTWQLLKSQGNGDLLATIPWYAPVLGGRIAALNRTLRKFPKMDSDGMRPQLIKLLIRWHVILEGKGVFDQPFAKRQAWLLMQRNVLRALPEAKEITFNSTGQVPVARLAVRRLVARVADMLEEGASKEAAAAAASLTSRWARLQQADFELWQWSNAELAAARDQKWDKATWRWKYEDDRIQRQS